MFVNPDRKPLRWLDSWHDGNWQRIGTRSPHLRLRVIVEPCVSPPLSEPRSLPRRGPASCTRAANRPPAAPVRRSSRVRQR